MRRFKTSRSDSLLGISVLMAATLLLSACGSGSSEPVPDVIGMELDRARDDVEDAGFSVETFGGGTFGPIDESAWVVCEQDPQGGATEPSEVELTVDRDCDGEGEGVTGSGDEDPVAAPDEPEPAKATFRASAVDWQAVDQARLKVMFTVENKGDVAGRPECFVEIDATDINDECFGECGAQDILKGKKLGPGKKIRTFGVINVQGGAAPATYDVSVLC